VLLSATAKTISLFIVRIVQEGGPDETVNVRPSWRGVVRHLQSGRELHFLDLNDIAPFIAGFLATGAASEQPEQAQE